MSEHARGHLPVAPEEAQLDTLVGRVENLIAMLENIAIEQWRARRQLRHSSETALPPASTPPLSPPEEARAALARDRIRQRRARENCFGAEFFSDPCWDIMLDLYAAHYEGEPVSISSLCIAASAPATTATRWIDRMTEKGLLTRSKDPADGRRIYIHLSKDTRLKLDAYFEALQQN